MALKLYDETNISAIADAIRSKNGSADTYTVGQMATAIQNIPSGSPTLYQRIDGNIRRVCSMRSLSLTQWSLHMYELSNTNYYLAFANVPMVIWLKINMSRVEGATAVTHKIAAWNYHNVTSSGVLVFPTNWEGTPSANMTTGIPQNQDIDSSDFQYTNGNLSIPNDGNAYSNNNPVIFEDSTIYNLDTTNSHPFVTSLFGTGNANIIANYMDGTSAIDLEYVVTCTDADVPSGFDLSTIDKGYLLYTTNNMYILAVGDSSWSGLKVNANDKLDAEAGETSFTTQNWNSSPCDALGSIRNLAIVQRSGNKPPFCEGNNDNYYTNVMYNTQDILDPNGNVKVPANITLADFKSKIFKLT